MKRRKVSFILNKNMVRTGAVLAVLAALFAGILLPLHAWEKNEGRDTANRSTAAEEDLVYYRDKWYRPKKGLETVLIIGVDQATQDSPLHREAKYEQSDFLLLLVAGKRNENCTAVHINRDTLVRIRVLDDVTNELLGTVTAQLALAHTYGNNPEACCRNTVDSVSDLLYGIPIDGYFSLTMDGVVRLNDLVGGVTLEVMDDLTAVDGELAQGKTVTLWGLQALEYVQARRGLEDPSNLRRMERQRQYLEALQEQLLSCAAEDEDFAASALLELNEYLVSDYSVERMSDLLERVENCGVTEYRTLEGEAVRNGTYMEYHVDEDAVREMVMEIFYEEAGKASSDQ